MKETKGTHASNSDRALGGIARLPIVALLVLGAFYVFLFRHWNAAPVFAGEVVGAASGEDITARIEKCSATPDRVKVTGWAAVKGLSRRKHRTTLLIRDSGDSAFHVIKTELPVRADVDGPFEAPFGEGMKYGTFAFSGSLNLRRGTDAIESGQLYLAYDTGRGYQLVELSCTL